jgi:hypothetical protein
MKHYDELTPAEQEYPAGIGSLTSSACACNSGRTEASAATGGEVGVSSALIAASSAQQMYRDDLAWFRRRTQLEMDLPVGPRVRMDEDACFNAHPAHRAPARPPALPQLVAIDDCALIARHIVEDAALDKRVYARVTEQDQRRTIIITARIARDLPSLREQLVDRERCLRCRQAGRRQHRCQVEARTHARP